MGVHAARIDAAIRRWSAPLLRRTQQERDVSPPATVRLLGQAETLSMDELRSAIAAATGFWPTSAVRTEDTADVHVHEALCCLELAARELRDGRDDVALRWLAYAALDITKGKLEGQNDTAVRLLVDQLPTGNDTLLAGVVAQALEAAGLLERPVVR